MNEVAGFTAPERPEAHPDGEPSINTATPKTGEEIKELLELIVKYGTKLTHDVSQPLTFMLTSLEMGSIDGGLSEEDCQLLLNASLQMRTELQNFRDLLRKAEEI